VLNWYGNNPHKQWLARETTLTRFFPRKSRLIQWLVRDDTSRGQLDRIIEMFGRLEPTLEGDDIPAYSEYCLLPFQLVANSKAFPIGFLRKLIDRVPAVKIASQKLDIKSHLQVAISLVIILFNG